MKKKATAKTDKKSGKSGKSSKSVKSVRSVSGLKRPNFFGRLTQKAMSPITNVLDEIDSGYSDRSRTKKALIAMFNLRVPICILLVFVVALSGGYFLWNSENTASTEMSLNYEEAAYGLNPNSTRFYAYDLTSPDVIEGMLYYCGIDPETVDMNEIVDSISVRTTNTKAIPKENKEDTKQEETYFISTTYRITMRKPASVKGANVRLLLNFLCKAYKDKLYNNYTENRSILSFDIERFNDQEYMVIADLFDLKAQQIEKYLNTRVKQNKTFTEQKSDETFKSLVQKVEDIRSYDIAKYRSFVKEAGCSHDKARYINSLRYVNRMKNIDYSKDMAGYTVYNAGIKMYNEQMANVVMIPSIDRDKNTYYMSRTKTGMDYMAKKADTHLQSAKEISKSMKDNNDIIVKMQRGKNTSADVEKANKMIKNIGKKFTELSKQIETVDKAYVKYKTKDYLTFKTTNASLMQRLQPTKVAFLAVVVLLGIYAAIWLRFRYFSGAEVE